MVGFYAFSWLPSLPYAGYQAMLRPLEIAGAVAGAVFARRSHSPDREQSSSAALAAAVSLGVAIDRSGMATLFKVYSFGRLPDQAGAVSHYDASDLSDGEVAARQQAPGSIVISDPYTLGLAKAIAGTPGIYLFSNLDTVNQEG